jgi:hypothetical protein
MDAIVSFCKKLRLGRMAAICVAGLVLLLNVACSNGNAVGARPNNPPVQMGGQNNPHKGGGDGSNDYQMSTDPAAKTRDRASLSTSGQLIAAAGQTGERSMRDNKDMTSNSKRTGSATRDPMREAQQIPEQPQVVIDRSDPNEKILEKTGRTFKEAAKHLTGATDESIEKTGMTQFDPNR